MIQRTPGSTRKDTHLPYTTLCRFGKVAGCPNSCLLSAHAEAAGHLDADAARKVVRELATRLDVESKFGLAGTQDGLHLRVALEALGHPRHLLGHLASAAMISVSLEGIALDRKSTRLNSSH